MSLYYISHLTVLGERIQSYQEGLVTYGAYMVWVGDSVKANVVWDHLWKDGQIDEGGGDCV